MRDPARDRAVSDPLPLLEGIPGVLAAAIRSDPAEERMVRDVWLALRSDSPLEEVRDQALERLRGTGLEVQPDVIRVGRLPAVSRKGQDTGAADTANPAAPAEAADPVAPANPAAPVVPANAADPARPAELPTRLLVLDGVSIRRSGDRQIQCEVKLLRRGVELRGISEDLDTAAGRARAGARATLIAARAEETPRPGASAGLATPPVRLEALQVIEAFGRRYAVLSVEAGSGSNQRRLLTGAAAVEASPEQAGCRATLGALERWLEVAD